MSRDVEAMFGSIAPRYDRANAVLSFGIHHRWRRRAVAVSGARPGHRVLDVATGTGDLAFGFERAVGPQGRVVGIDVSRPMLAEAFRKRGQGGLRTAFLRADALRLPFRAGTFDVASIAFGIRNLDSPEAGIAEMARVVRPGGRVVVLEFGQPRGLWGATYRAYSRWVMPRVGGFLTSNRAAYEYLPRTAAAFPAGARFTELMGRAAKFSEIRAERLNGGITYVYAGTVGPA